MTITRKANHSVYFGYGSNKVCRCYGLVVTPCIRLRLSDFCELSIQLRRLIVVLVHRLFSMSSEAIFVQGIYVDWRSYAMYGTYICVLVQSPDLANVDI